MKLLVGLALLIMWWQPMCNPRGYPTSPDTSDPGSDNNDPTVFGLVHFEGLVVDDSTGVNIDSAEVYASWGGLHTRVISGRSGNPGYEFHLPCRSFPTNVRIRVAHQGYEQDSLLYTVHRTGERKVHNFRLTRR